MSGLQPPSELGDSDQLNRILEQSRMSGKSFNRALMFELMFKRLSGQATDISEQVAHLNQTEGVETIQSMEGKSALELSGSDILLNQYNLETSIHVVRQVFQDIYNSSEEAASNIITAYGVDKSLSPEVKLSRATKTFLIRVLAQVKGHLLEITEDSLQRRVMEINLNRSIFLVHLDKGY